METEQSARTPVTDAEQWSDDTERSSDDAGSSSSPEHDGYLPLPHYQALGGDDADDGDHEQDVAVPLDVWSEDARDVTEEGGQEADVASLMLSAMDADYQACIASQGRVTSNGPVGPVFPGVSDADGDNHEGGNHERRHEEQTAGNSRGDGVTRSGEAEQRRTGEEIVDHVLVSSAPSRSRPISPLGRDQAERVMRAMQGFALSAPSLPPVEDMDGMIALRMHDFETGQTAKRYPVRQQPSLSKSTQGNKKSTQKQWTPDRHQPLFPRRRSMCNTNNMSRGGVGLTRTPAKDHDNDIQPGVSAKLHSPIKSKVLGNSEIPPSFTTEGNALQPLAPTNADKDRPFTSVSDPERGVPGLNTLYASGRADTVTACRAEKDRTVLHAVGAASASPHLRIAPSPAGSLVGTTETENNAGCSESKGAKIDVILPPDAGGAGGEQDDSLALKKLVDEGNALTEVNGPGVRGASFSKILRLFGATKNDLSPSQVLGDTLRESGYPDTRTTDMTGSATTSTSTSPLSSGPMALMSPGERPREFCEPGAPGGRRSESPPSYNPASFTDNVCTPLSSGSTSHNVNNGTASMRSCPSVRSSGKAYAILGIKAESHSDFCPPSPSTSLNTPRSSKRSWPRLSPWSKGAGGGTPEKSPRLGWGGFAAARGAPARPNAPARTRSFTYSSGTPVLEEVGVVDYLPLALPPPGGVCSPEVARTVTVLATPTTTLRFSAGSSSGEKNTTSLGDKSRNRVGFSSVMQDCVVEAAANEVSVRGEIGGGCSTGAGAQQDGRGGDSVERSHGCSSTIDSTSSGGRASAGEMAGGGNGARKVGSESELEEMAEAASLELSQYLSSTDRGWPWAGSEVVWADYVTLNGHHRWVRSEGCRHAFLMVGDALYLLELPADAVARATNSRKRNKNSALSTMAGGEARKPPLFQPLGGRGWYLKITASMLKFVTIPLSPAEVAVLQADVASTESSPGKVGSEFARNGGKLVKIAGEGVRVVGGKKAGTGSRQRGGVILHGRGWACAWFECASLHCRDSLVDVVSAWHCAETKGSLLKVDRIPHEEASAKVRAGNGATMASMLVDRKSCLW